MLFCISFSSQDSVPRLSSLHPVHQSAFSLSPLRSQSSGLSPKVVSEGKRERWVPVTEFRCPQMFPCSPLPQPQATGSSSFRESSSKHQSLTSASDPLQESGEESPNCGGGLLSSGCRLPSDGEKKNSHTSDAPLQMSNLPQSRNSAPPLVERRKC